MNFEKWLDDLIHPDTRAAAAKRVGSAQSTISRQLDRGHLRPEMVISLCRAYGRSPVDGLVETGYLYPHEIEGVGVVTALTTATNKQVLAEIERRITARDDYDFRGEGDASVIGLSRPGADDGTVKEFSYDAGEYAADNSVDEDEARMEGGEDLID